MEFFKSILKPREIFARPSKTFQFKILRHKLSKIKGLIGIDAGANKMKNRNMFKTSKYVGIDIDQEVLEIGLKRNSGNNVLALVSDLSSLDNLPDNIADLLVCTNTFHHLSPDKQIKAIDHFIRIVNSNGILICECLINKISDEFVQSLKKNFTSVKIVYFKNKFSQIYERIMEKDGYMGNDSLAGKMVFKFVSYLLSITEVATCRFRSFNTHYLIIASHKNGQVANNKFDLSKYELIGDRLYKI